MEILYTKHGKNNILNKNLRRDTKSIYTKQLNDFVKPKYIKNPIFNVL